MKINKVAIAITTAAVASVVGLGYAFKTVNETAYNRGVTEGRVGYVATPTPENEKVAVEDQNGDGYDFLCYSQEVMFREAAPIVKEGSASSKESYDIHELKKVFIRGGSGVFAEMHAEKTRNTGISVCRALGVRN